VLEDEIREPKDEKCTPNGDDKDLIPVQRQLRALECRIPVDQELCAGDIVNIRPSQSGLKEGCHGCLVSDGLLSMESTNIDMPL
jgi:hypothetical protein